MLDTPPAVPIDLSEPIENEASVQNDVQSHLPTQEREDGTIIVDLAPLAPKPQTEECIEPDQNPLDAAIIVCRDLTTDQRITPAFGPADEPGEFGSAVPRAKFRISDDATGEVNATNPSVGGWNANGGEVKVKIDF